MNAVSLLLTSIVITATLAASIVPSAAAPASGGAVDIVDERLLTNPLLAEVARSAPDQIAGILKSLDEIKTSKPAKTRSMGGEKWTPEEAVELGANPDLRAAAEIDQDAMLELLKIMNALKRRKPQ